MNETLCINALSPPNVYVHVLSSAERLYIKFHSHYFDLYLKGQEMKQKHKQKKRKFQTIQNNLFMLKYVFKFTPLYAVTHIVVQILFALTDIVWFLLITKWLVDAVFAGEMTNVIIIAGASFAARSFMMIISAYIYEIYVPVQKEKLNKAINENLHQKAAKLDYACYSNPEFYNDYVWAASQSENKAAEVLDSLAQFIKFTVILSGTIAVVAALDAICLIFLCISTIAVFVIKILKNKLRLKKAEESRPFERKRDYVNRVFYLKDHAKEIRLGKLKNSLINDYKEANNSLKNILKKYYKKFIVMGFISDFIFFSLLMDGVFTYVLAYRTIVLKLLSPGSFAALFDGAYTVRWSFVRLAEQLTNMQERSLYIEKLRYFLEYENKIIEKEDALPIPSHIGKLCVQNVCFTYDGCSEPSLKNISMEINPREKIAIVGYNGAGKSTLIKLLTRLYDVSSGTIFYDQNDIKDYKLEEYYKNFGTVFQDHQIYAATLHENIIMDVDLENERIADSFRAMEKSGFIDKYNSLCHSERSEESLNLEPVSTINMTREFHTDGISLSGGETQKVAISRVFANENAKILILDEPSSALDPLSESNLNKSMFEAAEEKTVIFISHRLSTTKIADRIYMMEKGEIIETGSHEELMTMNGKYCEMFNRQTENYGGY